MILLDTDVLIDVAIDRSPHAPASKRLIRHVETSPHKAFVAWHSLSNFYYLVRPLRGGAEARAFLSDLTRFVIVAPVDTEAFRLAVDLPMDDFEDAMQVASAHACGARYIATRNVADFASSRIPAVTPEDALVALR